MFHFTIRDVLWLTVVIAMGAAWWTSVANAKAERKLLVQSERELKHSVRVWKGRAGAVAESMQSIGITVEFFDDEKGMSYGPIPQYIRDHDRAQLTEDSGQKASPDDN